MENGNGKWKMDIVIIIINNRNRNRMIKTRLDIVSIQIRITNKKDEVVVGLLLHNALSCYTQGGGRRLLRLSC